MKQINFAEPDIRPEDIFAVSDFLRTSKRLTDGDKCRQFEKDFSEYTGIKYCLTTSSCMAALHLAYLTLGIKEGDEVICTAMSHVATAHAIELVGATPVFVDCMEDGNIDYDLIIKSITRKTKGIALVHYNGFSCDMDTINNIAKDYGLEVIEDCALALGSKHKNVHVGNIGIGCFSFYPSKHLTTGEGGMFTTNDYNIYSKAKQITSFGKRGGNFDYDIEFLGSNFRMSEMQAVLGIQQLKRIDEYRRIRRINHTFYDSLLLSGVFIYKEDSPYCYIYMCESKRQRETIQERLKGNNIQYSIYYPHPIPRLKYYQNKYGYKKAWYPNAERIADCFLALPVGPHINEEDIKRIVGVIKYAL